MKIKLMEYNVTPNIDDRNEFNIIVDNEFIMYENQKITDVNKINEIINLLTEYKDIVIKLNNEGISNFKGGRQKFIKIKYEDSEFLEIVGNTPSVEMSNLYSEIKEKIINIIEK